MNPRNRGSSRRRKGSSDTSDIEDAKIPQLPWKNLINPFSPMEIITAEQVEKIHLASMRILEEFGIEMMSARALDIFKNAGAEVDYSTMNVRIDRDLVKQTLKTAPSQFTLTPRNPQKKLFMGGNNINFSLVAGPPNVHDFERGRRSGNYQDYCNFIKLAQYFNIIHLLGNQVLAPIELPANSRHLDAYYANLLYSDLCYHCTAIGRGRAFDGIQMMAIARGISLEDIKKDPSVATIISVNSPRKFDEAMAEGLMVMAEYGQPVAVTPFTLMGAMTPVTLAAALAQQNAEALIGIVLTQLINPGVPVIYGSYTSNVDMRSGAPAFGTPENSKANIASGQLARYYSLPYRCSPTNASNIADGQAVYETEMALWSSVLAHGNLIYHAAGWLEGGLTASYEKLILDVEMLQHMAEFLSPIEINDDELAIETIAQVPTGGHFFGEPHTMERYKTAFYQPIISDWQNYENWQIAGEKTATERATETWKRALSEYEQPFMKPAIKEELEAYIAHRREKIGDGEP